MPEHAPLQNQLEKPQFYDASEYAGAGENDGLGVWTWRGKWNGKNNLTRDGNYALLPATVDVAFPPGSKENQPGWGMDTASVTGSYLPSVWRFLGPEPLESFVMNGISYQARPGVLLAHPGGARLVAATWRAPRTGVISLAAQFQDAATGPARSGSGISWFIQLRKEKPLASGDLAAGGTSALLQRTGLSVKEGDLLHFAIDPRGSFPNDTTSLLARVSYGPTAAPDPARDLGRSTSRPVHRRRGAEDPSRGCACRGWRNGNRYQYRHEWSRNGFWH